jgi:PAS domain S-box-containing protein
MTDRGGAITYANDKFCQISGHQREEILGQNHRMIKSECHPRAFYDDLWQTVSAGRVWHGDICNRKRSGELYWVSSTVVPLMDEDGQIAQYIAIRTDISERKEAESALIRAKEAAEQANRVKSDFLANMSHEIRTPMNGIIGMTELTLDTDLSAEQRDHLNMVKTSADSLLHIVNEILDFSKIEAGRMDIESIEFSLSQMLRDSTASLVVRAKQKNLELLLQVAPDVPDRLIGDPGRLRQVIVNLVSNAVKFTHEGKIEVAVSRIKANLGAQAELGFSVRDTGIGIAKEKFDVVFDSFSQADTSTTRKYGGTGLGLTISAQLVALMGGGRIGLESEVGQGSTFHFKLRLSVGADDAIMTALGEPLQPGVPLIPRHSLRETRRKLNLLLAEDNVVNQALAVRLMQKLGHTVTLANNGIEAVQHWQTGGFDAILMDIDMPLMNGYEATERIRAHELATGGHIPIVAMTAHAMRGARETCLQHGMDAYLAKPIDTEALWRALDGLMSERGAVLAQTLPLPQTLIVADFDAARQAMDDDRDLFEEIVQLFLRDAPVHMQHIRDGLAHGDSSTVLHSAHTIKGMVGIFAAERSVQAAAQLENLAAQGDLTAGAIVAASELEAAMSELRMAVEIYRLQDAPAWSRIRDQLAPTISDRNYEVVGRSG